jgi:hypothetical protein
MTHAKVECSVKDLIRNLEILHSKKSEILAVIENPVTLMSELQHLHDAIEIYEVKRAITEQIQLLIVLAYKASQKKTSGRRFDGHRLHTVFYGPPGVGKSRTAKCLARIWKALGIMSDFEASASLPSTDELGKLAGTSEKLNGARTLLLELYSAYSPATATSPKSVFSGSSKRTVESVWTITQPKWEALLHTIKETTNAAIDLTRKFSPPPVPIRTPTPVSTPSVEVKRASSPYRISAPPPVSCYSFPETPVIQQEQIVICGREDLVAPFSGQTSEKAKNFLMNNRGRCIIFEEAYSLCTSDKDDFGKEALVVLNRFMDEYGDQVVVIFTGYRTQLMDTIFKFQPGLIRRCQSTFEIKGYTPEGLAAIFTQQLDDMGWSVSPEVDLLSFFTLNISYFGAFGGDTDRLALHCKLVYGGTAFRDVMLALETSKDFVLTSKIDNSVLSAAFEEYLKNRIVRGLSAE